MSKFKSDKVMPRYFAIAVVLTLIGFAIVGKALYIMTAKKTYWTQVASRLKRDSVSVKPSRGNIRTSKQEPMIPSASINATPSGQKKSTVSVMAFTRYSP